MSPLNIGNYVIVLWICTFKQAICSSDLKENLSFEGGEGVKISDSSVYDGFIDIEDTN